MWIGRADGAGWTFPRATVLAIPLLCLLYVVSRPGVPHTGELESDDIPRVRGMDAGGMKFNTFA